MKAVILSTIIFLTLTSCTDSQSHDYKQQETPKALEDKSSSYEIVSKRGDGDLVESLYNELAEKTTALKELENKIDKLSRSEGDSTEVFAKFNTKNNVYYSATDRHIEQIKDTLLRDNVKKLIAGSLAKYNTSTSRYTALLNTIETKNIILSDLHSILKIIKTLPLIEKYQKDNLPTTKSFEGFIKRQNEAIRDADSLTKK